MDARADQPAADSQIPAPAKPILLSPARPIGLRLAAAAGALLFAAAAWLPLVHLFFRPASADLAAFDQPAGLSPLAESLAARQFALWSDPVSRAQALREMRASNAEWDFMSRTFFVLSLANIALREPARRAESLAAIDAILEETLRLEREKGKLYFMMDYARGGQFADPSGRSLFIDGEIAMMLAARQLVEPRPDFDAPLRERTAFVAAQIERGPFLCGESYPDECWVFCNVSSLAALVMADRTTGENHAPLARRWIEAARKNLLEPKTGLLYSTLTWDGEKMDGPEGSSIFWIAHCLQIVDPAFADDQYRRARAELGCSLCGFGFAREWPESWAAKRPDVDSGPIIPILGASAGSSGMAILGAAAFGERDWLARLLTTLNFAAFPERDGQTLRYCASNQVGDAVLLYSLVQGPLWARVEAMRQAEGAKS